MLEEQKNSKIQCKLRVVGEWRRDEGASVNFVWSTSFTSAPASHVRSTCAALPASLVRPAGPASDAAAHTTSTVLPVVFPPTCLTFAVTPLPKTSVAFPPRAMAVVCELGGGTAPAACPCVAPNMEVRRAMSSGVTVGVAIWTAARGSSRFQGADVGWPF